MSSVRRLGDRRVKLWVAGAVAVAVVASSAAVVGIQLSGRPVASGFDCSKPFASAEDAAWRAAVDCDVEVEITSQRTPWESTYALPNGNLRSEISAMPSRVSVDGEWVELDTSIVSPTGADEDKADAADAATGLTPMIAPASLMVDAPGSVSPALDPSDAPADLGVLEVAAPVFPIELNVGGSAGAGDPLGSITREGERFDVWFPASLPAAQVDGSKVVYDLAEGVRLIVSIAVDGTGFLPVVELADPAAAARFAALVDAGRPGGVAAAPGDLVFSTALSEGLALKPGPDGEVLAVDAAGETQFVSAPAVMWDSAGGDMVLADTVTEVSAGDRELSPQAGDAIAAMPTKVDGANLVITPDAGMLASGETVWPVYVDPAFSGHGPAEWVAVRTGGYTGTLYKWKTGGGEGTGYCTDRETCNVVFRQRLSWEFTGWDTIRNLDRANIVKAGFTVDGIHSASCTATTTDLVLTNSLSTATTWSNIGTWSSTAYISSRTEAHNATCLNRGDRTWDATEALRRYAENNWSTVTMGLKPRDESTMTSWKRFGWDATISVEYNRPPVPPGSLHIDVPDRDCGTGAARPFIGSRLPTLSAYLDDADAEDSLEAVFALSKLGAAEELWRSERTDPVYHDTRVDVTVGTSLADGTYMWHATSRDAHAAWSGWGPWCEFTVDTVDPTTPMVAPMTDDPEGEIEAVYERSRERGGVGQLGKFTISPNTSTDVVAYMVSFKDQLTMTRYTVSLGKSLVVPYPATDGAGAKTLYVKSVDRAGNESPLATFPFEVGSPEEDAIWTLDEGTGTTPANSGPKPVGPLAVTGATWDFGPHELFGSRPGDHSLKFDGVNDAAVTDGPVVDMKKPFVVSTHVQMNELMETNNKFGTVLAQDGLKDSGFRLGYNPNLSDDLCPDSEGQQMAGCWEFQIAGAGTARSTLPVRTGEWVHLVGEYDTGGQARLQVCNVGTPTAPTPGEPREAETQLTGAPADAGGVFTVGRAQQNGMGADWFHGLIDNVRVFSGEIVDDAKVRRLCQGAEASDFGTGATGLNALDPTWDDQ